MSIDAAAVKKMTVEFIPFTHEELESASASWTNLNSEVEGIAGYMEGVRALWRSEAHTTHKAWRGTARAAEELAQIVSGPDDAVFRKVFSRVLDGGGWDAAVAAAASGGSGSGSGGSTSSGGGATDRDMNRDRDRDPRPWAVLVTGLNGIRKTTSIYQPWFATVLAEALTLSRAGAGAGADTGSTEGVSVDGVPCGCNSFFRQLDFIVATLANNDFRTLYETHSPTDSPIHPDQTQTQDQDQDQDLDLVDSYARTKDAIFARHRKAAEVVGLLLVDAARARGVNVMVETSGRDVAMYDYVDFAFPATQYRKLAVHFTINDVGYAERSVGSRMASEMGAGWAALQALQACAPSDVRAREAASAVLVAANAGGPYGPGVLRGVQAASDAVWAGLEAEGGRPGWDMARLCVTAHDDRDWTVHAHGSEVRHSFGPLR